MTYAVAEPEERYRVAATACVQDAGDPAGAGAAPRRAVAGDRRLPRPARGAGRTALDAPVSRVNDQQGAGSPLRRRSAPGRSARWSCRRSPTSPSTCPRPPSPSRCPGHLRRGQEEAQRLGRVLRPKADGGRRTSTRSSAATPSTASTPPTGSGSSLSRATRTRSSTPPTWPDREVNGPDWWTSPPTDRRTVPWFAPAGHPGRGAGMDAEITLHVDGRTTG